MKNNYAVLENEYRETVNLLADTAGWSAEQAESIVSLVVRAAEKKANAVTAKNVQDLKNAKYLATKKLLKNYRRLREAIHMGTEHALKLLEDTEYQRLMDAEESLRNQQVQSVALQAGANRVLWAQINAALECFKGLCEESDCGKLKRQCGLLFDRYIAPQEMAVEQILASYHVEKSVFYADVREATKIVSLLLFGPENAEDFIAAQGGTGKDG